LWGFVPYQNLQKEDGKSVKENEMRYSDFRVRPQDTPTQAGLHRFIGYRKVSLRNDFQTLDEVVLVEWGVALTGLLEFQVLRFGKQKKEPLHKYQGKWYYIGDRIERITTHPTTATSG
jgi:hypothetical protein